MEPNLLRFACTQAGRRRGCYRQRKPTKPKNRETHIHNTLRERREGDVDENGGEICTHPHTHTQHIHREREREREKQIIFFFYGNTSNKFSWKAFLISSNVASSTLARSTPSTRAPNAPEIDVTLIFEYSTSLCHTTI